MTPSLRRARSRATDGEHAEDAALLEAVARGEQGAVRRLLDDVAPVVNGYIYARVGGDRNVAEDLLQDTLLEAVKSAASFRAESSLSTWMCAIARRRLARYYEAERRAEVTRHGLQAVPEPEEELGAAVIERRDEVVRALGRIPATHRQVLVLKYLDGLAVEEIASELGRTRVQVQSLLQRARDGLRRQLEGEGA